VFVRTGLSGVVATTADYIVQPNAQVNISKPLDHTHVAYITGTSTSSAHIIAGDGF
jgi:2-keto-3-deoxy-6-phosphogluconate aldolase